MLGGRSAGIKREPYAGPVREAVRCFGYAGQIPGAPVLGDLEARAKRGVVMVVETLLSIVACSGRMG